MKNQSSLPSPKIIHTYSPPSTNKLLLHLAQAMPGTKRRPAVRGRALFQDIKPRDTGTGALSAAAVQRGLWAKAVSLRLGNCGFFTSLCICVCICTCVWL